MKLASALFAAAASELTLAPLDLEWDNVAKGLFIKIGTGLKVQIRKEMQLKLSQFNIFVDQSGRNKRHVWYDEKHWQGSEGHESEPENWD